MITTHSATKKHLFLYPQVDRLGLSKPKKDQYKHFSISACAKIKNKIFQ